MPFGTDRPYRLAARHTALLSVPAGLPLSFHASAYKHFVGNGSMAANLTANLCPYRNLIGALVFSGALDRHPNLRVVFHESGPFA